MLKNVVKAKNLYLRGIRDGKVPARQELINSGKS